VIKINAFVNKVSQVRDVTRQISVQHIDVSTAVEIIFCSDQKQFSPQLGTCIRTNEEPYGGCSCPSEFSGPTCSNDPCQPSPCLNGGQCIRKADNQFYCQCRSKHKGVFCERKNSISVGFFFVVVLILFF